jgi:putative transposase
MTIDRIGLKELVEKGSDADLLREMIAFVATRMMDMEVEGCVPAQLRDPPRSHHRHAQQ